MVMGMTGEHVRSQHVEVRAEGDVFGIDLVKSRYDAETGSLWSYMDPPGRPNFSPELLRDLGIWQDAIVDRFSDLSEPLRYVVFGSRFPGIFNCGGDLDLFARLIHSRDRDGLVAYGRACTRVMFRNLHALDLPLITIALVQGEALGGGFEASLSFDVIIAERRARFGLPEVAFGLFPGMGAHSFLIRRIGSARTERMIRSGQIYTAEEMYDLGIVHVLAENGEGERVAAEYVARGARNHAGHLGARRAARLVENVTREELDGVIEHWADSALGLNPLQLRLMQKLTGAQSRLKTIVEIA